MEHGSELLDDPTIEIRPSQVRRQLQSSTQELREAKYREEVGNVFKMPPILNQHNVTPSSFIAEEEGYIKYESLPGLDIFQHEKI